MSTCEGARILDQLTTAVVVCDGAWHLKYLNAAAEMLFEINQQRIIGKPISALITGPAAFLNSVRSAIAELQSITIREVDIQLSQSRQQTKIDCAATPLQNNGSQTGSLLEITPIDRLSKVVRDSAWHDRSNANRAVIRGIAHEIKNPLGGLRGAAQLLERELNDNELREYTSVIVHEVDRLTNLVNRMTGPVKQLNIQAINIHDVLEHVRTLVLAEGIQATRYRRDYDPTLPEVAGNRESLIQAVFNIARNAMEAMAGRGEFTVRTRVAYQITIRGNRHRHVARIDFIDDGPGIPYRIADTLFYPMVTGRADGTGLGLSITQDIVDRLDGLIEFESEPGNTRFTLYLPFFTDQRKAG